MAGETLSMSQCLGEVEWMQIFYRDLAYGDVKVREWHKSLEPYLIYPAGGVRIGGTAGTVSDH